MFPMIIRDAVHGDIELTPDEVKVLDTPELQRLRAIKQLGTAYLVYPGCTHSRFEHSLGTMAVAKRIIETIERSCQPVSAETKRLISIGALLHDVTHIPFGHTFEDERKIFSRHDKGSRLKYFLREDSSLGQILASLGILSEAQSLLGEKTKNWQSQIISSSLDADLLDYLRRDAYMAGLAQTYDPRIFHHFRVADGQLVLNMVKHNMDRPDVKSEIIHLLRLRYYLTERVYFHHAKVVSGAMISKALEMALEFGLQEADLLSLGDYTLFEHLKHLGSKHNPSITELVKAVEVRRLLKRAYILSAETLSPQQRSRLIGRYHSGGSARSQVEGQIACEAGLNPSQVILYCPGDRTFREAAIPVLTKDGLRKLNAPYPPPPQDIQYLERQYEKLWRLYVFAPAAKLELVNSVCREVFAMPSEHW